MKVSGIIIRRRNQGTKGGGMSKVKGFPAVTTLSGYIGKPVSRRIMAGIISCLLAIFTLLPTGLEAQAQTSTDNAVKITAKPGSGAAGTIFSFSAQNFVPDETIATYVRWPEDYNFVEADVLFKVDNDGNASWTWDSTGVPPGNYTMVVVSQTNPERTASLVFTVLANNDTGNSNSSQMRNYNFAAARLRFYPSEQILKR